ncbi:MAG: hypothetical protein M3R06_08910 [Chloroflexota bacterium]|nr:hypothetical protein [Chloroflexota bacterium]
MGKAAGGNRHGLGQAQEIPETMIYPSPPGATFKLRQLAHLGLHLILASLENDASLAT